MGDINDLSLLNDLSELDLKHQDELGLKEDEGAKDMSFLNIAVIEGTSDYEYANSDLLEGVPDNLDYDNDNGMFLNLLGFPPFNEHP